MIGKVRINGDDVSGSRAEVGARSGPVQVSVYGEQLRYKKWFAGVMVLYGRSAGSFKSCTSPVSLIRFMRARKGESQRGDCLR